MVREQAIFLEVHEDLNISGDLTALILAYHDFITGFDFSSATDLEVHQRAVDCLKRYKEYFWGKSSELYNKRHDILENLDLDNAKWEYLDRPDRGCKDAI